MNQIWILKKIYKDLLEYIQSRTLSTFTSSSLSERLESKIIKSIWEQVSRRPKQDSHDRLRVHMPGEIYLSFSILHHSRISFVDM